MTEDDLGRVIPFPKPTGSWVASIELIRLPDGSIRGSLMDMPAGVIDEIGLTAFDRMLILALWTSQAGASFFRQAIDLKGPEDERPVPANDRGER